MDRNETKPKPSCLVPGCDSQQSTRGMCQACYRRALRMIEMGNCDWDWLEEQGYSVPRKRQGRPLTNNLDKAIQAAKQE